MRHVAFPPRIGTRGHSHRGTSPVASRDGPIAHYSVTRAVFRGKLAKRTGGAPSEQDREAIHAWQGRMVRMTHMPLHELLSSIVE